MKDKIDNTKITKFIFEHVSDCEDSGTAKHDLKCMEYESLVGALLNANLIKLS